MIARTDLQGDPEWPRKSKVELHIQIIFVLTSPGDFLGPYMWTFDDLSHVLVCVCFFTSCEALEKWPKIAQNGPKKAQNDPILS